jgi:hypothetical protein
MIATPDRMTLGDMGKDGVENVWNGQMYRRFQDELAFDTPAIDLRLLRDIQRNILKRRGKNRGLLSVVASPRYSPAASAANVSVVTSAGAW